MVAEVSQKKFKTPETSNNANLGLTWNANFCLNPAKLQIRPTVYEAEDDEDMFENEVVIEFE